MYCDHKPVNNHGYKTGNTFPPNYRNPLIPENKIDTKNWY